jgi:hypothetical protein
MPFCQAGFSGQGPSKAFMGPLWGLYGAFMGPLWGCALPALPLCGGKKEREGSADHYEPDYDFLRPRAEIAAFGFGLGAAFGAGFFAAFAGLEALLAARGRDTGVSSRVTPPSPSRRINHAM